jgi:hypothetical protein
MDIFSLIGAGSTLTLVGLCYKMSNDKNGKYILKDVCNLKHRESEIKIDAVRNMLENKIIELKDDIIEVKSDVKELLKR